MGNRRYSMEGKGKSNYFANLLYISSSVYEGDWSSIPHTHSCIEFFYVVSGAGKFLVEDEVFDVQPDDLVVINPHVQHTERSLQETPLEYVVFGVADLRLDLGPSIDQPCRIYNLCDHRTETLGLFNAIIEEIDQQAEGYESLCLHYLSIFLVKLVRTHGNHLAFMAPEEVPPACGKVKQHIDNHYATNLTLNDLAALVHWNKYHLVHEFTRAYSISPIQYLREKRVQVCKELLERSDHNITQIALMTGFSSQSYFSQSFKSTTGISPLEYRKKVKNV